MEQFQRGGQGDTLCLSSSCMQCKKHNQRKVVMCKKKDCKFFDTRLTLKDRTTGIERPYNPENTDGLVTSFPRQTLRSRGY